MVDILEWVMDAELFEKFSSDKGQISLSDLFREGLSSGALSSKDISECMCLNNFLFAITIGKGIAYHNEEINEKYCTLILKLPKGLSKMLSAILSNADHYRKVEEPLSHKEKEPLEKIDLLKNKLKYIAVAHRLNRKIIVSTCNDIEECYSKYLDKLMSLQVNCENVCDACKEIK